MPMWPRRGVSRTLSVPAQELGSSTNGHDSGHGSKTERPISSTWRLLLTNGPRRKTTRWQHGGMETQQGSDSHRCQVRPENREIHRRSTHLN
ncbi:hypothetical protein BDQ94DRAFT_127000 [Aspergillus welwitschiae]|uniref:Uncharacterized protein n=1 Tax=Aspergillus welwitschiae TaxID=1341132 RepID=A0A3F3PJ12_9EURO|nr:hypothetical protein BDQ94DRAFT_127000 [Aspergillus welwitschiae]RDH26867.1 hypothetical protein BDQ94DRAFT_127000 [Aspergillus welwitschiae]